MWRILRRLEALLDLCDEKLSADVASTAIDNLPEEHGFILIGLAGLMNVIKFLFLLHWTFRYYYMLLAHKLTQSFCVETVAMPA